MTSTTFCIPTDSNITTFNSSHIVSFIGDEFTKCQPLTHLSKLFLIKFLSNNFTTLSLICSSLSNISSCVIANSLINCSSIICY